jgi:hypothetical protein
MDYLCDHMVITSFVGIKSSLAFKASHLSNNVIGEGKMWFDYILKRGFFMFEIDGLKNIKKILMLTPLKSSWGMCIFQN